MDKMIHSVCGNILPQALGFCQCHEHVALKKGKSYEINPALCIDDIQKSVKEVSDYMAAGGSSIVEAQPAGCGRDSEALKQISLESGVNIIASTGFHKLLFYPENHWIRYFDERRLTDIYVQELTRGMYTDIDKSFSGTQGTARAGIIKTALDVCDLSGRYETLFKAAANAQRETGAVMMVHIERGSSPLKLVRFLEKQRTDLSKIYFCHMDRAINDFSIFKAVLREGIFLEFDTIGRFKYHSDEFEIELMKKVIEEGCEDMLLISLDTTRERLKSYNPQGIGLTYILETFIPAMKQSGIAPEQIKKMVLENPKRILAW